MVPREIEQNQTCHADDCPHDVEFLKCHRSTGDRQVWDDKDDQDRHDDTHHAQHPVRPGPPNKLGEYPGKHGADEVTPGRRRSEQTQDHVLSRAGRVRPAEHRDSIGKHDGGAYPLHGATEREKDERMGEGTEARHQRPDGEPAIAQHKQLLVPKEVTPSAGGEDERSHRQRVARGEPRQVARVGGVEGPSDDVEGGDGLSESGLGEELCGRYHRHKQDLVEEGKGRWFRGRGYSRRRVGQAGLLT